MIKSAKASIRKSGFNKSRPWVIDLRFDSGYIWQGWGWNFKTKKSAIEYCETVGVEVLGNG